MLGDSKRVDEAVEGRAEIVQALSDEEAKLVGWGTKGIDPEGVIASLRIKFDSDAVRVPPNHRLTSTSRRSMCWSARYSFKSWSYWSLMDLRKRMREIQQTSTTNAPSPEKASRAKRPKRVWEFPY